MSRLWGSANYCVDCGACLVGSSSPCCLCLSDRTCLVPNTMLTFAVAVGMHPVVIGGWAAAWVVFFCAVSACLSPSTRHCNMAIGPALLALGHDALSLENFAIFWLIVVHKTFRYQCVGFIWCSHIDQEWPMQLAIFQGLFLPGHPQEF